MTGARPHAEGHQTEGFPAGTPPVAPPADAVRAGAPVADAPPGEAPPADAPHADLQASRTPTPDAPEDDTRPAIALENVGVRFGDVVALDGVSLTVRPGAILGLIGPSGAGKTTAIRILTGSLRRSSGSASVLGEDPEHFSNRLRGRIGYMPQRFSLYPDLTSGENVDFVASLFGLLFLRRRRRVREVLKVVDLWHARGRRASDLSGGMQRRLELACALVHDPAVLFLDEPTAGIDPLLRRSLWDELQRLRDLGRTLVVTTQHVSEAEECDAVALISEGRLVALAGPEDLRRMATGGDILDLETETPVDPDLLSRLEMVRGIEQRSARHFLVTVDDAGTALPRIVGAIEEAGFEVASSSEYRPSFDDVFAALVSRHRETLERAEAEAAEAAERRRAA
jgi:ABC-2 type transport system ATP-binding protein